MEPEIQPATTSSSTQKKFNLKRVAIASGVSAVVLGAIAASYLFYMSMQPKDSGAGNTYKAATSSAKVATKSATPSAKKDETADWKTFDNKEAGFTIKYPPAWLLRSYLDDKNCTSDASFVAPTKDTLGICASGFGGLVGISKTMVGDDSATIVANYKAADYTGFKKENTTVAGKPAVKISGTSQIKNEIVDQTGQKVIIYILDLTNRTFILSYNQPKTWGDESATFETIVTTLTIK